MTTISTTTVTTGQYKRNLPLEIFLWILRIGLGGFFIFSGTVKANDPTGLAIKMSEILEKMHLPGMMQYSMILAVLMIGFEIIAGVATIIGFAFRPISFLLLLLNLFFTGLTAWIYFSDLAGKPVVTDCGCLGDCFKISNTATFWKDVILLLAAVVLFIARRHVRPALPRYPSTVVFVISVFFAFGFQWYVLEHGPFYDCMPFKKGNDIASKMIAPPGIPDSTVNSYKLKNSVTGEVKEYTDDNYPEDTDDTTFEMISNDIKIIRAGTYPEPAIKGFVLSDSAGQNHVNEVLQNPGYSFLLFIREAGKSRMDNIDKLKVLYAEAQSKGIAIMVISSYTPEETAAWRSQYGVPGVYYSLDGTMNKTAVRTNPGLILIKAGVVQNKWSFRDYPATVAEAGIK